MKMAPFIKGWLPLGVGLTLTFGTVYLVGQQLYRQSAYDPQLQRARDATLGTIDGPVVDMAASLAAFQTNVNQDRRILGTTGQLDGVSVLPPAGVFDYARAHSENHLTWQPRAGVRLAAVVVKKPGGYVLVARNLSETEKRTQMLLGQVVIAWLATLLATLVVARVFDRHKD